MFSGAKLEKTLLTQQTKLEELEAELEKCIITVTKKEDSLQVKEQFNMCAVKSANTVDVAVQQLQEVIKAIRASVETQDTQLTLHAQQLDSSAARLPPIEARLATLELALGTKADAHDLAAHRDLYKANAEYTQSEHDRLHKFIETRGCADKLERLDDFVKEHSAHVTVELGKSAQDTFVRALQKKKETMFAAVVSQQKDIEAEATCFRHAVEAQNERFQAALDSIRVAATSADDRVDRHEEFTDELNLRAKAIRIDLDNLAQTERDDVDAISASQRARHSETLTDLNNLSQRSERNLTETTAQLQASLNELAERQQADHIAELQALQSSNEEWQSRHENMKHHQDVRESNMQEECCRQDQCLQVAVEKKDQLIVLAERMHADLSLALAVKGRGPSRRETNLIPISRPPTSSKLKDLRNVRSGFHGAKVVFDNHASSNEFPRPPWSARSAARTADSDQAA